MRSRREIGPHQRHADFPKPTSDTCSWNKDLWGDVSYGVPLACDIHHLAWTIE